ncbi:MAG: SDR family NAD(P)-dependent oxidoreductase [Acidobacteriota bacterium]
MKTILITGSTDGIGLETARLLASLGHRILLHGRDSSKLAAVHGELTAETSAGQIEAYRADLSRLQEVDSLAAAVSVQHDRLDVLINNAGVYNAPSATTTGGLDVRFAVNTLAPFRLTGLLLPRLPTTGRVVNLSSAAQAPVDLRALTGKVALSAGAAYAQSKLALTMWCRHLGRELGPDGPAILAVNPGSLLATKMVHDAFGVAGGKVQKGAEILRRAALDADFGAATGQYFDNDSGRFADPHPDALDEAKVAAVVSALERLIAERGSQETG